MVVRTTADTILNEISAYKAITIPMLIRLRTVYSSVCAVDRKGM